MILNVASASSLKGRILLPASKSYSIRAFIIAACGGTSHLIHPSNCEDALVAMKTAKSLGSKVQKNTEGYSIEADLKISSNKTFLVGESGTSLRFLLPLLPMTTQKAIVKGHGTLVGRPNAHLCQTLRDCGMNLKGTGPKESVPLVYQGGAFKGGTIEIDGSLSSQFISALLIAAPLLPVDSRIRIIGKEMVSVDYIVMTRQILEKAGIAVKRVSDREYWVKGHQTFKGLKNFKVPSDYGLAAFSMAAASILSSKVVLAGHLKGDLVQSDGHILEFLTKMGVVFKKTNSAIAIEGPFALKGGTFSLKNCPDLVPIMAVLALFAKGQTKLVDIVHARAKESDRISDVRSELLKVGADVKETSNALIITPQSSYKTGQLLDSHHDHRLAMAWTVLGMKIGCRVEGIESCRKSYPDFVKDMKILGLSTR
ncbi:MAG: 3-phosphoshikimate 1-carboxyvinyltransferase [Candidatus Omnitrophica bacterium]|nr:3-phosphoshikimate 1-carboxyvinyltransferase [Candidatus Omnitrophota bacterium]